MVACDYDGGILVAATSSMVQVLSPMLAEAHGLRWALVLASELGFQSASFETDSFQLYNGRKISVEIVLLIFLLF